MITPDGWVSWALRRPGPANKLYSTTNGGHGIVWHSMEGWMAGSLAELDKPERQASWMFSIGLDGILYQHYPITASCWASGNGLANRQWWSVELEGIYSMPINAAQLATALRLIEEWKVLKGREVTRVGDFWSKTMWEHREVDTLATPNAGETGCPSERYAPLWAALEGDMPDPRLDEVITALGGIDEIRKWNTGENGPTGNSLLVGYALEQAEQDATVGKLTELQVQTREIEDALMALDSAISELRAGYVPPTPNLLRALRDAINETMDEAPGE